MKPIFALLMAFVTLTGCANANRDKPPGSLTSGNPDQIQDLAEGSASSDMRLRSVPIGMHRNPEIPLVKNPRDKVVYINRAAWPDKSVYHEPFFMHVLVNRAAYALPEFENNGAVALDGLDNIIIDENGRVVTRPSGMNISDRDVAAMGSRRLPFTEGGQSRVRTTRVLLQQPDGSVAETFRGTSPAGTSLVDGQGRVNQTAMATQMAQNQAALMEAARQAAQPQPAPTR